MGWRLEMPSVNSSLQERFERLARGIRQNQCHFETAIEDASISILRLYQPCDQN